MIDDRKLMAESLYLPAAPFRLLLELQGPSLGLWRAAEIAALREQAPLFVPPILDLGCGDGIVTSLVTPRVDVGLDPDPAAFARARERGIYARLEAVPITGTRLPDGSMGTVLSNSVLEHLARPNAVLATVARVLRPGGRLIFTVPTGAFGAGLALPLAPYAAWRNRALEHRNLWPAERWARRLARAGLAVETVRPYLRPALVRAWDLLELLQQVWVGRRRVFSLAWRRIPPAALDRLAAWMSRLDLAAPPPGAGQLIVARKM